MFKVFSVALPRRRVFALAGVFAIALSTAGCFDKEPEQRRAFITFLQTRIVDKPGLHIPIMSDKDIADLGPYADQYRIMNGFHHRLNDAVSKDLARAVQIGKPRSLQDLASQRAIIPALKDGMAKMKAELDKAEAEANAARLALKQPPDLKFVYDTAYERMVTRTARTVRELLPMIDEMLPPIEALAVYLDEHRAKIEFRGASVATRDPVVRAQLTTLLDAATKAAQASEEGKRKLNALVTGR